ncbi:hypothetical protein [Calothrix sp. UHCC 0171]|uniref:hypothetical protein n=1 Tax=Calothrix sp. UHCC 0171 TaxID=3110245 RepID=UPI002B2185DD|nr:hypothetical protein [Calothrix sp. UHCC 0171]MEA5574321.1 hypothetical protein [Calothrix sp. UHCC 0171]
MKEGDRYFLSLLQISHLKSMWFIHKVVNSLTFLHRQHHQQTVYVELMGINLRLKGRYTRA